MSRDIFVKSLQFYIHEVGLEEFLKQLEDVLGQAENDTSDFDVKGITQRYERAKWGVHALRRRLFAPTKTRNEMEKFLVLITMKEGLFTEEVIKKRVSEMNDEELKKQYENLSWLFNSKGDL